EEEPAKKPKRAKKPAKKSTIVPITGVVIRDTPGVSVTKKKVLTKADRGKGMDLLSEAELLKAAQLKKNKLETHKLHESGSSDEFSSQPKVPDESEEKKTSTDEGTDSDDDSNDDDSDDASNNDDDDVDSDAGEEEYEEECIRTPDSFEFTNDDEEYEELYKDVNVKLKATEHEEEGKGDAKMTDAGHDDGTQQTIYEQVKDDKHVRHEEPSTQTPSLLNIIVTVIPETSTTTGPTILPTIPPITSLPQQSTPTPTPAPTTATTTTLIPTLPYFYPYSDSIKEFLPWKKSYLNLNKLTILLNSSQLSNLKFLQWSNTTEFEKKSQAERKRYINLVENSVKDIIKDEVKSQLPQILPKEVSEFATPVIQSTITKSLKNVILAKSSSQPKSTYEAATSLTEDCEDKDKDEDPSAGSDQGLKRRKTSKDDEPSKGSKSKESKSSSSKCTKKITKAEKPPLTFDELMSTSIDFSAYVINNLKMNNLTQEYLDGPAFNLLKGTCKIRVELEYHFEEYQGHQVVPVNYFINNDLEYLKGGRLSRKYTTSTTKTKAAKYDEIQGIKDIVPSLWSPVKHDVFATKRIITVTHVKVMKWYDYGYLEEIEVRREDQQLYKKLSNMERDVIFDLNVALRMFTRRVVILKRVEDLQLGVESYQKKLNITKPETFKSDISNMTLYTAYNNPQGIIYLDNLKRNRLMHSNELYKFCDGTLTSIRTILHDIASSLRMDYLPKRRWSKLDRRRSRIMIKAID
ncbi:hypothetical protein Tco_0900549, partial [Tanacetum coccineum]